MLNPDALLEADGLRAALDRLQAEPAVAAVQGAIVNATTGTEERSAGRELGVVHLVGRLVHARALLRSPAVRATSRRVPALRDHVDRRPAEAREVGDPRGDSVARPPVGLPRGAWVRPAVLPVRRGPGPVRASARVGLVARHAPLDHGGAPEWRLEPVGVGPRARVVGGHAAVRPRALARRQAARCAPRRRRGGALSLAVRAPASRRGTVRARARGRTMTRSVAFYLPQFHRIPENDRWWGDGFTEWTQRPPGATALRRPRASRTLPGELGYYDLTRPEVRAAQADAGAEPRRRRVLLLPLLVPRRSAAAAPVRRGAASPASPTSRSCCAGPTSPGRGAGAVAARSSSPQRYSDADDLAHVRALAPAFADPRYVRVDGKPVFLVYRASSPAGRAPHHRPVADRSGPARHRRAATSPGSRASAASTRDPARARIRRVRGVPARLADGPPAPRGHRRRAGSRRGSASVDHALPAATRFAYDDVVRAALGTSRRRRTRGTRV